LPESCGTEAKTKKPSGNVFASGESWTAKSPEGRQTFSARAGYGYGGDLLKVKQAAPQAKANRVEFERGKLTEWYINGPAGLEQGFNH